MEKFKRPIADLHCDLLHYLLQDKKRSAFDLKARCAVPQLREGNVKLQVMAIYTDTQPGSAKSGLEQAKIFQSLEKEYLKDFAHVHADSQLELHPQSDKIAIVAAVENASAFSEEAEDFDAVIERLNTLRAKVGKLAYVSLTWNMENRFGGGALTKVGLKEDGQRLIEYLDEKNIPLDFSHASDYLAYDMINFIEKKGLRIPVLASHSNMRSVIDVPRNIPDEIAKEIFRRKGIIGLNFIRYFVGKDSPDNFSRQVEHALLLGGETSLCFGADFFYEDDAAPPHRKPADVLFFPEFGNASVYPKVLDLWKTHTRMPEEIMQRLCYDNLIEFLRRNVFKTEK